MLPAVALPVAAATECVRVVVDYGTEYTRAPNTRCVSWSGGDIAADALAQRAKAFGETPPRYEGNFLCAIDGYPESGCGDHGTEPYWSFWIWRSGKWSYSSFGVDSYAIEDGDGDGHPDPIGFRYHEFAHKHEPRPNPGYPAPTRAATTPPGGGGSTAQPSRTTTTAPVATRTPGGPTPTGGATGSPTPRASRTATPTGVTATATSALPAAVVETEPATPPAATGKSGGGGGGGVPAGTAAAGVLAAGLIGAAAWRYRRGSP
jgi:hypothetical protein